MQPLLSHAGELAITRLMQHRRVLLAFDFDGTLAPIVDRPEDARIAPATAQQLAHLARHMPVAVVTGRSVADVRQRLGFDPAYVVGNHGAEGLHGVLSGPGLTQLRQRLLAATAALDQTGVSLEDKGLSLALHYRLARDPELALQTISRCLADLPPDLTTFGGKCVVNVVLRHAPDKGDATLALLQASACDSLLFVGDDVNDEAVFARADSHWLTVRIGQTGHGSRAMYFLESPAQMNWLLARIGQHLGAGDAGPGAGAV
jgi:trehalose 6-phosphate phosphatase